MEEAASAASFFRPDSGTADAPTSPASADQASWPRKRPSEKGSMRFSNLFCSALCDRTASQLMATDGLDALYFGRKTLGFRDFRQYYCPAL
jgi:hypothetical protein